MLQARELRNIAAARTVPEQNISASVGSTLQSVQQPNTDGQSKLLRAQEITVSTFEEIGSRLMKAVKGGKPGELHMLHNLTRPPDACFSRTWARGKTMASWSSNNVFKFGFCSIWLSLFRCISRYLENKSICALHQPRVKVRSAKSFSSP